MKTAFEILGVTESADDQEVKRAYLQKVQQYPPEQATEQFQQIRVAYEAIKDARSRVAYQLFDQPEADFDKFLQRAFVADPIVSVDGDCIVQLLQTGVEVFLDNG